MEKVDVTVIYLEMLSLPDRASAAPRADRSVLEARHPSVDFYRFLYNSVGKDYNWLTRRKMPDADLALLIQDPLNEIHVLYVDGSPAGFAELDRTQADEVELVQFGLLPEFTGQGLGKWFLRWTVELVFSYHVRRFWLHTCTLDHRYAVATYEKAGFEEFKREQIRREL